MSKKRLVGYLVYGSDVVYKTADRRFQAERIAQSLGDKSVIREKSYTRTGKDKRRYWKYDKMANKFVKTDIA